MKIFFDASLSGKNEYGGNYETIVKVIEKLGHTLIKSTLFERKPEDVALESSKDAESWYKQLKKWLMDCDVAVFEVSYSSTGIGHEVSLALESGKPVVALYVRGKHPFVLETIPSEKIQVRDYEFDKLEKTLEESIELASSMMDTRFNFFISSKINSYFDWVSKKKRIPRAVYLRRLIEEEMAKERFEE